MSWIQSKKHLSRAAVGQCGRSVWPWARAGGRERSVRTWCCWQRAAARRARARARRACSARCAGAGTATRPTCASTCGSSTRRSRWRAPRAAAASRRRCTCGATRSRSTRPRACASSRRLRSPRCGPLSASTSSRRARSLLRARGSVPPRRRAGDRIVCLTAAILWEMFADNRTYCSFRRGVMRVIYRCAQVDVASPRATRSWRCGL